MYWRFYYGPTKFDRDIWLKSDDDCFKIDAPRLRIADGFVGSKKLLGLTRKQIDNLLSTPTPTNYFKLEYDYVYSLGPERSFIRIDSECLVIKFGPSNEVIEARIVTD